MIDFLKVRRITFGSLFTLLFVGMGSWIIPLIFISGIIGFFGGDVLKSDKVYVHGWQALLTGVVGGPLASVIFSFFASCFYYPGLWIYSFFRPLSLTFFKAKDTAEQGAAANP